MNSTKAAIAIEARLARADHKVFWERTFWRSTRGSILLLLTGTFLPLGILTGQPLAWTMLLLGWVFGLLLRPPFELRLAERWLEGIAEFVADQSLDLLLVLVVIMGAVSVAIFGFAPHLLRASFEVDAWSGWHWGAIVWAGLLTLYLLRKTLFVVEPQWFLLLLYLVFGVMAVVLWRTMQSPSGSESIAIPFLLGLTSFVFNAVVWWNVRGRLPGELDAGERKRLAENQRDSLATLLLADIPTVFAFLLLGLYILGTPSSAKLDVFASGAVSFQLLASKCIFIFIEANGLSSFSIPEPPHELPVRETEETHPVVM